MKEKVVKIEPCSGNQPYLSHVRDIACKDPNIASLLLGMSPELAYLYGAANGYPRL